MSGKVKLKKQWDYFKARVYSKEEQEKYIGVYYKNYTELYPIVKWHWAKILECHILQAKNYIFNGLALLLDDGYWHFGCPENPENFSPNPSLTKDL